MSRGALTVDRAVCAAERRSVRPLAAASRGPCTRVPPHWAKQRGGCDEVCPCSAARSAAWAAVSWDRLGQRRPCRGIVDAAGEVVSRFTVAHTAEGLQALVRGLARAGVAEVAIERGDGPVVDALLAAGMTVVVITPRQVKNLRSRYGSAST